APGPGRGARRPRPAAAARLRAPEPGPGPAPAALAWSTDKPPLAAVPPGPGGPPDPYGRSADYRWLQGVLERTPGEQWLLRYEALARDGGDGRVLLEGHPRLDLLHPGDVVRVPGP